MSAQFVTVTQTSASCTLAPECMNLAAVFTEQGTPIPCGSACLDYVNLSAADNQKLKDIINKLL
ncbi:hypothetical protein N7501_004174 [Penicillium viridicatum]|nr:hypothetical protein N7501_004174 [Penicillium viridicatum]